MIPKTLLFAVVALTLAGCRNWLVEEPQSFFTPDDFPTTEADLKIALGGIDDWYTGGQSQAYFHRGWPMLTEVPTDQTVAQSASDSRYAQDSYTLNASNEWLWRVWRQIYGAINQANVLIARIPQMTQVSQDVKDRYLGAFKFHRAFNHFNAVRVWGSVPLMMRPTTEFATATQITRAPIAEIYEPIAAFRDRRGVGHQLLVLDPRLHDHVLRLRRAQETHVPHAGDGRHHDVPVRHAAGILRRQAAALPQADAVLRQVLRCQRLDREQQRAHRPELADLSLRRGAAAVRRGGKRGQRAHGGRVQCDQSGAGPCQAAAVGGAEPGPVPRRGAPGAQLGAGLRVEAAVRPEALGHLLLRAEPRRRREDRS